MKIKELFIDSFGKLGDISISLDDKITVITGKNEAGKSSIASFIKYMLYGFPVSRSSLASENEKKKYMPWEADACSGEMSFEAKDGKNYRAARKTAARNQSAVFDENGVPCDIQNAGEHFFGVDENCFVKTAFIGESKVSFKDDGELDEAIRNMVYSADEGVDSAKAIKKLDTLRRHYLGKTGKSGEIYNLNLEIRELEAQKEKWQNGHKELMSAEFHLGEITKKIAFNKEQKEKLEKEYANLSAMRAKTALEEADKLREAALESKAALEQMYSSIAKDNFVPDEAFSSELEKLLKSIADENNNLKALEENVKQAELGVDKVYCDDSHKKLIEGLEKSGKDSQEILESAEKLSKKSSLYFKLAILFTVLIITLPLGIFFFVGKNKATKELQKLCLDFGCADLDELKSKMSGISAFKNVEKSAKDILDNAISRRDESKNMLMQKAVQLHKYAEKAGFEEGDGIAGLYENAVVYLDGLKEKLGVLSQLKMKCNADNVAYKTLVTTMDIEELRKSATAYDESLEVREESVIKRELAFYTQANDALSVKERELEKTAAVLASTLPKPGEIQSKINSLTAMRDEMLKKHSALDMAVNAIEEASQSMKKEASPLIAAQSGKLFCTITDGKYTSLFTDTDAGLSFLSKENAEPMEAGYLSTGTLDAAYISLRIALCKYLYKENPILVFDDAFSHMDDERLKNTMEFIHKLSEEFQIIILSCHKREAEYLDGKAKIINFELQ